MIVDKRESQSIMLCSGRRGDGGHELQGLVLCPRGRGDSGQSVMLSQSITLCSGGHGGIGQKSHGVVLCPGVHGDSAWWTGKRHKISCSVQGSMVIMDKGE